MEKIYDPFRKSFFVERPEEKVRQKLLHLMIDDLGYPKGLVSIEKDLRLLPHLKEEKKFPPKRRVDILCFAQDLHPNYPLYPLLVVECKAEALTRKVVEQAIGYNHFIKAFFICVANETAIKFFFFGHEHEQELDFLPSYSQCVERAKKCLIPSM